MAGPPQLRWSRYNIGKWSGTSSRHWVVNVLAGKLNFATKKEISLQLEVAGHTLLPTCMPNFHLRESKYKYYESKFLVFTLLEKFWSFLQNDRYCKNEVAVFSWQGLWRMEKCIISTLKLWNWNCCSCRRKDKFCLPSTVSTEFHRNDLNFIAEGLETRSTYSTTFFAASLKKKEKLDPVGSTVRLRGDKAVYWFSIGQQWLVLAVHWVTMRQLLMLLGQ